MRIVKAKLFIDDRFADNIDLGNIANQANFSKFHFIRLFKSIYGLTPKNYLIKTRIDKAKKIFSNRIFSFGNRATGWVREPNIIYCYV